MTTSGGFAVIAFGCEPRPRRSGAATYRSPGRDFRTVTFVAAVRGASAGL